MKILFRKDGAIHYAVLGTPVSEEQHYSEVQKHLAALNQHFDGIELLDKNYTGELPTKWDQSTWAFKDGIVYVDLAKAIDWKIADIRAKRVALLAALDTQRNIAVRRGTDVTAIDQEIEYLCDLPDLARAAESLEDLESIKL